MSAATMDWRATLNALKADQERHYSECAMVGAFSRDAMYQGIYQGETIMTEGVIKGIEYAIEALAAAEAKS